MKSTNMITVSPSLLASYLEFAIKQITPVLIAGAPGIGKSDIVEQAANKAGANIIITHPVVSDPTDYKGLPFAGKDGIAHFLPFDELNAIIEAKKPTLFFLDDLGQAPVSVQAACMQLILARRINGHKVSPHVTFVAATNRKTDKAGVSGLLEPVKSRFTIMNLEVDTKDWVRWAFDNNMPFELIAFINFRPELLSAFEATKDISNTPSPRNVAEIGRQQAAGLPVDLYLPVFGGRCGEKFAIEYNGFLKVYRDLPNIDQIVLNPSKAPISDKPHVLQALCGALANKVNDNNIGAIIEYLERLPAEIQVASMQLAQGKNKDIVFNTPFAKWSAKRGNHNLL